MPDSGKAGRRGCADGGWAKRAQLYETAKQLVGDAMRLDRMKSAQSAMSIPDAAERIYAVAMEVYKEKR